MENTKRHESSCDSSSESDIVICRGETDEVVVELRCLNFAVIPMAINVAQRASSHGGIERTASSEDASRIGPSAIDAFRNGLAGSVATS